MVCERGLESRTCKECPFYLDDCDGNEQTEESD